MRLVARPTRADSAKLVARAGSNVAQMVDSNGMPIKNLSALDVVSAIARAIRRDDATWTAPRQRCMTDRLENT